MSDQSNPPQQPTGDGAKGDGQNGGGTASGGGQPMVHCHSQYVKDLSFENPNPLTSLSEEGGAPDINMNVEINVEGVRENTFEVSLKIDGKAVRGETHLFVIELDYAGLFTVQNIPPEHFEQVLYVHCPTLLFPFARQIVGEVTRNGGYPPLLLNAVDFNALYMQQAASRRASQANPA